MTPVNNQSITINDVLLVKQTEKALLLNIKGAEVWAPISKAYYSAITKQLSMPKWLWDNINLEVEAQLKKKGINHESI